MTDLFPPVNLTGLQPRFGEQYLGHRPRRGRTRCLNTD